MKRRILSVAVIALTCAAPLCAQMAGETAAKNVSSLTLAGGKTDLTNRLTIALAAGSAGALTWTLPMSNGTSGYSLQTDGAGNLSWASASGGSAAIVSGATAGSLSSTRTYYNPTGFGAGSTTIDAAHCQLVPSPCSLTNLHAVLTTAPMASQGDTFAIYRSTNGGVSWAATAVKVAIGGASATSGYDIADTIALSAGDLISLSTIGTAASAAVGADWGFHLVTPTPISGTFPTVIVTGGSIDGTAIGAATPSTGAFTKLTLGASTESGASTLTTVTETGTGASGSHHQQCVGQVDFIGNGSSSITATVYNDNITDNSIVIFTLQGNLTSNGPFVGGITTAPSGTNHNFTVTIQRRLTATIASSEHCKVNYIVIN